MKFELNFKNSAITAGTLIGASLILNGAMNVRQRLDEGYDAIPAWAQGFFPDNGTDIKGLLDKITGGDDAHAAGLENLTPERQLQVGNVVVDFAYRS